MIYRRLLAIPLTFAVAAVTLAVSNMAATAQTTACPVTSEDQAIDASEQHLLGLINQYRAANGKNALAFHPDVTRSAAWLSRDMATRNYFSHTDRNGRTPDQRLMWCGATFTNWGENIYAGSSSPQDVFNAWRNSPGHNAIMLRDGVSAAGIGRAYNAASTYRWYWTLNVTNSAPRTATTVAPTPTTTVAPTTTVPRTTTTTAAPTTTTVTRTPTTVAATTTTTPPRCPPQYAEICARYGIR